MKKMSGQICDVCRTMFYPGDIIHEFCDTCAHTVYCVMNVFEDGSKELSSIHHNHKSAEERVNKNIDLIAKLNSDQSKPIKHQIIQDWSVIF